jgi:monofunctional glycosyltransferase
MDRADDTSEQTTAPNTASRAHVRAVITPLGGVAAGPVAPSLAASAQRVAPDPAIGEVVDQRPGLFNVPWPLPPRAFSQSRVEAPSPELIAPLPLHAAAYVSDVGLTTAVPPRSYLPASVGATLKVAEGSSTSATRPLSFDAALSEIEAEVYARTTTVEAAIAQVRLDRQTERQHGTARGQTATPRIMSAVSALRPQLPLGPLVADPASRPAMPGYETWAPERQDYRGIAKRALRIAGAIAAGWLALVLLLIIAYRFINPPISALMLQRWVSGQGSLHEWVNFEDMSPNVIRAVLVSEDARFCEHNGIDYEAIEDAVEDAGSGRLRGASTISMQVVKNLFLWPSKSYLRKAIELPLTYMLELIWPKRRIMEVYLNIAEWGPGIFGVGTASKLYFSKPAKSLSEREAARLAVALPNPLTRNAGKPGPGTRRLAGAVQVRMRFAPSSQMACLWPKRRM